MSASDKQREVMPTMKRYTDCPKCSALPGNGTVRVKFSTCSPGRVAPTVWEPGDKVRMVGEGGPRTDNLNHCAWYNERNHGMAMACAVTDKVAAA